MKMRLCLLFVPGMALAAVCAAQNANPVPSATQAPSGLPPGPASAPPPGWRAGVTGRMAETGMGGRGVAGTVTAMAPGIYTVKTETGQVFKVQFSANTRFLKQAARGSNEAGRKDSGGADEGGERGGFGNRRQTPPEPIKQSDIKIGDEVAVLGEINQNSNSVGAAVILQIDPERAKLMRERQANFGKTWLMGRVTAINETTVSLMGMLDDAPHDFKADENTAFRKHRAPITLADLHVGDMVRVEGAVRDGSFVATSVSAMDTPGEGAPRAPDEALPAPQAK